MRPGPVLLALLAVAPMGCDLRVHDYGGAKIELTIRGAQPTRTGHIEVWARDGEQGIVRITPTANVAYGIVQAVDFDDPCMINTTTGGLLWKAEGQEGTDAERDLKAKAVALRIHELTDLQPEPLLAFVDYDDQVVGSRPTIAPTASPSERLAACTAWWNGRSTKDPGSVAYAGNPLQLTAPIHGTFEGSIDFVATKPSQIAGGIELKTNWGLRDLRELWITQTTAPVKTVDVDQVDCVKAPTSCRGAVILQGYADTTQGRGVFHVEMRTPWSPTPSPQPSLLGGATVYTALDQDPVQF